MNNKQQDSARRIRRAVQHIEQLVQFEEKRRSEQRKRALEKAYGTLTVHAERLHLPLQQLSTGYSPQEYLRIARDVLNQLTRLEAITQAGPPATGRPAAGQDLCWRVQPEESAQIQYQAFQLLYGFAHQEIDALIAILGHYYPTLPIQNRSVEWAVLKQRDMEAQDVLARHYKASHHTPWQPEDTFWWDDPTTLRQRTLIALYFGEWLHATYPLAGGDDHGHRLIAQTEAVLSTSVAQLTDLSDRTRKGESVSVSDLFLALAHAIGSFISLTHLSAGNPDGLNLVWQRFSELCDPREVLIVRLASYYERLAEQEPPIQDDEALLGDIFTGDGAAHEG